MAYLCEKTIYYYDSFIQFTRRTITERAVPWFGMVIAICDFHLLVEAAFYHGGFVSETPKFLLGGLRRNDTRKIECRSLIYAHRVFCTSSAYRNARVHTLSAA